MENEKTWRAPYEIACDALKELAKEQNETAMRALRRIGIGYNLEPKSE